MVPRNCLLMMRTLLLALLLSSCQSAPDDTTTRFLDEAYATGRKEKNGLILEYVNDYGKETLTVKGSLEHSINQDEEISSFRKSLGLQLRIAKPLAKSECIRSEEETKQKSLLESFADFFGSTKFGGDVRHYYNTYTKKEIEGQVAKAHGEMVSIESDLSKLQTQEMILRQRQAELGAFLKDEMSKPPDERNPTVIELVTVEDDRLALLENRLNRLKAKLSHQKAEVENYISAVDRTTDRDTFLQVDDRTRIYKRDTTKQPSSCNTVIQASDDSEPIEQPAHAWILES